jgi:hypothetical protein
MVAKTDRLQGEKKILKKKAMEVTSFWHGTWVGVHPLKEGFPILFLISSQKSCSVLEVG